MKLMRFKRFFFIFLMMFPVYSIKAQEYGFSDSLRLSYEYISALKISEGQKILTSLSSKKQNSIWIPYEKNFSDFLEVFTGEDRSLYNSRQQDISNRYNQIEAQPENNPYRLWMLANLNLQSALISAKFGQNLQSAWSMNKAYRQITNNTELFPDFVPNELTLGVLHVLVGIVPEKYRWVLKIFSMEGTVMQGQKEIYSALNKSLLYPQYHFLKNEALFYLSYISLNLSPKHQNLHELMLQLNKVGDQNLMMSFLKVEILIKTGKSAEALAFLNKISNMKGYYPFYLLYYLKGDCLLKKLDISADSDYRYFLHHYKGVNYIKDAWRKRAWVALLRGDTLGYHHLMDSVLVKGANIIGPDKQAFQEAEEGKVPNLLLLRSRLLFDGGYYEKSKKVLNSTTNMPLTTDEQLERVYRFGRIAQKQSDWTEAKKEYRRTIVLGRYSKLYFAGNSALKLGEIYEVQDSLKQAAFYYNLCLQLNFQQYRRGIRFTAKESLARVQKALKNQ